VKNYFRVMLGKSSVYASGCVAGGFIGTDFGIQQDLSRDLPEEWREFKQAIIPVYLAGHPHKTKIGAGWHVERSGRSRRESSSVISSYALMAPGGITSRRSLASTSTNRLESCRIGDACAG
jgi:hypothetical protein